MAGGFDALGIIPELIKAVTEMDWYLPTDVQDEAIPLILGGGDVCVAAETGSGKTAAFSLPIIQCCVENLRKQYEKTKKVDESDTTQPPKINTTTTDEKETKVLISDIDKDSLLQIQNNGLTAIGIAGKNWIGARATHGIKSPGKYYYEAIISSGTSTGITRLGWSTISANLELGKDIHGYGYGGTAMKSNNNKFEAYGIKFGENDVVGCCIDLDIGNISFQVNGIDEGIAHTLPSNSFKTTVYFPAFSLKSADITLNFGAIPFKYSIPHDFIAVNQASSSCLISSNNTGTLDTNSVNIGKRTPLAVIIEPVKDLAEQVYRDILSFSQFIQNPILNIMVLVGGDDYKKQLKQIDSGVDILICTPQKCAEMVKKSQIDFKNVRFFILDEADSLASDAENMKNINYLYNCCPITGHGDNRLQVCFFSATLHSPMITELSKKICVNPTWVDLKGPNSIPDIVHHVLFRLDLSRDIHLLSQSTTSVPSAVYKTDGIHSENSHVNSANIAIITDMSIEDQNSLLIKKLKPFVLLKIIDTFNMSQCMIFCRTNLDCELLEQFFCSIDQSKKFTHIMETGKQGKYSCAVLGGMRSINERRTSLEAFKSGVIRFLICTDVAGRGIDVKCLPFVINYTLPDEPEYYIHRIGRVGRADYLGLAISIIAPIDVEEKVWYHICANRGKNCHNINLKKQGGCTVWYNENDYLEAIQRRLDFGIPELSSEYELPESLINLGVKYGEKIVLNQEVYNGHLELIEPTVRELAMMEVEAQNIFLRYNLQYGKQ